MFKINNPRTLSPPQPPPTSTSTTLPIRTSSPSPSTSPTTPFLVCFHRLGSLDYESFEPIPLSLSDTYTSLSLKCHNNIKTRHRLQLEPWVTVSVEGIYVVWNGVALGREKVDPSTKLSMAGGERFRSLLGLVAARGWIDCLRVDWEASEARHPED